MLQQPLNSVSDFRRLAASSEDFVPTDFVVDKKHKNPISYVYREHQVVIFFDSADGVEAFESRIVAEGYPASPSAGKITKFTPQLMLKLVQRHEAITSDLAKAAGSFMSDGILAKPLPNGRVSLFISRDVSSEMAERVLSVLRDEQSAH